MRALVVNKYWRPHGGVEEYTFQVASFIAQRGHQVVPFSQNEPGTLGNPYLEYFVPGVDSLEAGVRARVRSASRAIWGGESVAALESLLDEVDIDVAHVMHVYHQIGPRVLKVLKKRGIPTILSIHDYKLCCPSYRLFNDKTRRICTRCLRAPTEKRFAPVTTACWKGSRAGGAVLAAEAAMVDIVRPYDSADLVLVSNQLMRDCALAAGVDSSRIRVLMNSWPPPDSERKWTPGGRLLFVGRLVVEKGIDQLVESAARTGLAVDIIGDGPIRTELEKQVNRLGADVRFLGPVRGSELERAIVDSAALVIPSVWHEVSPLVCYQAMSLGVPVIASKVGGMTDLLGEGRGLLYEPEDLHSLDRYCAQAFGGHESLSSVAERGKQFWADSLTPQAFESNLLTYYAEVGVRL